MSPDEVEDFRLEEVTTNLFLYMYLCGYIPQKQTHKRCLNVIYFSICLYLPVLHVCSVCQPASLPPSLPPCLPACLPCFLVNNLQTFLVNNLLTFFPVHFRARNNNIIVENYGDSVQDREIPNPITVFEEAFEHYGKCLPSYTCWVILNRKDECHTAYHTHNRDCNKLRITFLSCR